MLQSRKPWGYETLLHEPTAEAPFVLKRIWMERDKRCSLQYHVKKTEYVYVISGKMLLTLGDETKTLCAGEGAYIANGIRHRMAAAHELMYMEASTIELDDVVRLEDDYGRV